MAEVHAVGHTSSVFFSTLSVLIVCGLGIQVTQKKKDTRNTCSFYRKGFESLLHQQCTHHPSGMVFNGELLRGKLKKEHYFSYLADQYTYSYLMRDMLQYGDSAIYDYGCWNQRPPEYLKNTRSGSNTTKTLYFYPEISYVNVKDVFNQAFTSISSVVSVLVSKPCET